jgi:hypothetical protein
MSKPNKPPITNRPLTRKQEAFVKHLVNNPKSSATEAAAQSYNLNNRKVASVVAAENLRKPNIITELSKYNNLVENTLVNTVQDWGQHDKPRQREIAIDTAKYIHDKIHGKSTQRSESVSTVVTLNLELTEVAQGSERAQTTDKATDTNTLDPTPPTP